MSRSGFLVVLVALSGAPLAALGFDLPQNARVTAERNSNPGSYSAPVGVWKDGSLPVITVEGEIRRTAYRIASQGLTPLQVAGPLRQQLIAEGYTVVLDCAAAECGGFDFRFAVETLPAPGMYVNLRAFRFITAFKGDETAPTEVVTLLASTTATTAQVQIVQAGALKELLTFPADVSMEAKTAPQREEELPQAEPSVSETIAAQLAARGSAVLSELDFEPGTSALGASDVPQLIELAAFLQSTPGAQILLVGHTDNVGSLDANVALSRSRAESVRQRLISTYGVDPSRVSADGVGFLAPIASNKTPAGREANRRVEAVLIN